MKYLLLLFLCVSFLGTAQENIKANLIDIETNLPVEGATLKLINDDLGIEKILITKSDGSATFRSVPTVNEYQIQFDGNDVYEASKSQLFNVRSNESPSIKLYTYASLSNAEQLDEVVITSNKKLKINRRNAEVSFEIDAKDIEQTPVEGRDITRVLFRLPNVTQATGFYPEAPNVSINGANPLFTNYTIDGMDNNERFLGGMRFNIPAGAVKDITVLTSNYSAEYGLTSNGVIDITTKSGTNTITGETYFISRPGPGLDASSQFAQRDLSGNQVKDGFARYQSGFAVGGPIVKDKTFFFLNYEHTTDVKDNLLNVPELGVAETVRGENTFNYITAKVDHLWSENFRSSLRANLGLINVDRQGGGLEGGVTFPSASDQQERNSLNIAFKNNYQIGKIDGETNIQFSRFRWNYSNPENVGPQVTIRDTQELTIGVLGNSGFVFDEIENTTQFQQKFKYYLNNHTIKAGIQFLSGNHELFGGGNPNGNYLVDLTQAQIDNIRNSGIGSNLNINDLPADVEVVNYGVELRPNSFGTTQNIYSFYLEDQWQVNSKLNLVYGLRYDYDDLSKGGSTTGDTNNFAPRFNFNYEIGENSVLRGGYGIAYDKVNYAIYSDALQQNTASADYQLQIQELIDQGILPTNTDVNRVTFDGNLTANLNNVDYLQGPTPADLQDQRESVFSNERRILNPNGYDNPYSHQFSLGYQTQIDEDKLFFVDVFHNRGFNLFRLRNLNAADEFPIDGDFGVDDVRTLAAADATRPIPIVNGQGIIDGQVVSGVARNVIMTEAAGRSEYWAASFNLQKTKGDDNYDYRINYTLSRLENNTEDINFRAQDGNNYGDEWGPSINDRTHNINGIFNYYPLQNTVVTFAGLLQSGQPINRIPDATIFGTTDLNGDGSGFGDAYVGNSDRSPGESRNSDRLPWSFNFDLGIQHQFLVGETHRLELRADIFNIFNVENLSGYSNNATQSNQIQAGPASSGRFVQRNAGPPRQFQFGVRYLF